MNRHALEVCELTADRESDYAGFVERLSDSMIYASLPYRSFLQRAVGGTPRYLVALRDGRIAGVLPYFERSHPDFGTVVNSLPWYGSHGGCVVAVDDDEARSSLLSAFAAILVSDRVSFATTILTHAESAHRDDYSQVLCPTATDTRVGQVTRLPDDGPQVEQRLEALLRQKTRNLVRKARMQGFELANGDTDAGWRFLYETHLENLTAMGGRPKPPAHFEAMRHSIPVGWRRVLETRLAGTPVASVLLFKFNKTVEYVTPVVKREYRSMQPLSFAIWHGMLEAVGEGYRHWNWGGTWASQGTLHHFKAGWAAADLPYYYLVRATAGALSAWRRQPAEWSAAFPYYYVFPHDAT